jgi:molybdopterin-binding protein
VILIEDGEVGLDLHCRPAAPSGAWFAPPGGAGKRSAQPCSVRPAPPEPEPVASAHAIALGAMNPKAKGTNHDHQSHQRSQPVQRHHEGNPRRPVLSEIDVQTASGIVTSVITTRSVKELELQVGSEVIAFVKSTEVSIAKL